MARLIRDWPCMLPPRRSSLRNMVSFLFNSKEMQSEQKYVSNGRTENKCVPSSSLLITNNQQPITCNDLPLTLLTRLLSEAILQRDCAAITGIVANWPGEHLNIGHVIPKDEYPLTSNYMTKPSFVLVSSDYELGHRNALVKGPSLLDGFILGFLSRQPACKLKTIDFTGFEDG